MTFEQMKMFITTADCLNFTQAASCLFITPSSLSRQISSLERELNIQLFVRNNRQVILTPAGRSLYDDLQVIYRDYSACLERARHIQRGMSAELRIGVLDGHILDTQFTQIVRHMDRLYPNVRITLLQESFSGLIRSLNEETVDLIITIEFSLRGHVNFEQLVLSQTKEYLVTTPSSPLAQLDEIHAKDLANEVFICISKDDSPSSFEMSVLAQHACGCQLKVAPTLGTASLWAQAGIGFIMVNSHNYLAYNQNLCSIETERILLPELSPTGSDLVMAWKQEHQNPALFHFLELCQDHMRVSKPPIPTNLRP